jgi:DNA-directed RNA polymerase III subunit RPC6
VLLPLLQQLINERRVQLFMNGTEVVYRSLTKEAADRLSDLSAEDMSALQAIERAGTNGIWVRTLKLQTRMQQTQITKVLKRLESRKLVKTVKSVVHKARKMYMLYDLEPAKHLTGE